MTVLIISKFTNFVRKKYIKDRSLEKLKYNVFDYLLENMSEIFLRGENMKK